MRQGFDIRRLTRYSLRTLLLGMLVVTPVLGYVGRIIHLQRCEAAAREAIPKLSIHGTAAAVGRTWDLNPPLLSVS